MKSLLQNTPSLEVPVIATLGREKDTSFPVKFIGYYYELRRTARRILSGNERLAVA
jgi:hypothetical protein